MKISTKKYVDNQIAWAEKVDKEMDGSDGKPNGTG